MNETVRRYVPFVDFLEMVLGKNSEIVLHDFSDPDHAIVDIRNGAVSGRAVGAPATDLALKIIHDPAYNGRSAVAGYESRGAGNKPLRSASYFIREGERIVGMICVNTDVTVVNRLNSLAKQFSSIYDAAPAPTEGEQAHLEVESLTDSTSDLVTKNIADMATARGLDPEALSQTDRVDIIRQLNANGIFLLKGAVASTAQAMGISEPSVYRYLQKVRKEAE